MAQTPPGLKDQAGALPDAPGVYLFRDAGGRLLYVGKAARLRARVGSYFRRQEALPARVRKMAGQVASLEVRRTTSEAEALLLESQLIKEHRPRYNVALRDDKSYPMLKITNEPYPRLRATRRRLSDGAQYFGPYTDAGLMHEAVRFMRRVFPMRTCRAFPKTPCLEYHLGQCLAPCAGYVGEAAYQRIVEDLAAFLRGERDALLRDLTARMERAARSQRYEEAARLRDQIQALTSVVAAKAKASAAGPLEQMQAALKLPGLPRRIEAFDISNIFGAFAVGSMVVFRDARPLRRDYRRFRIETVRGSHDVAMMAEVVRRRYEGTLAKSLPRPDLIVVDGGPAQLGAARGALRALGLEMPAIGLAKRFEHIFVPDEMEPIVLLPNSPVLHLLQHVRDEAHRVAVTYHRRRRAETVRASVLHDVPGIGPVRAAKLLRAFGSVERIRRAPPEAVADAAGIGMDVAEHVLSHLSHQEAAR
ncbi:MAG TPA: excinuclease ABC subunit UvrC [bacterium]